MQSFFLISHIINIQSKDLDLLKNAADVAITAPEAAQQTPKTNLPYLHSHFCQATARGKVDETETYSKSNFDAFKVNKQEIL